LHPQWNTFVLHRSQNRPAIAIDERSVSSAMRSQSQKVPGAQKASAQCVGSARSRRFETGSMSKWKSYVQHVG
jgi:hypothetical protein